MCPRVGSSINPSEDWVSGQLVPDSGIWKLVWGLRIPSKVKNFIWRSCRDAIPVKKNLKRRQILQDDRCDHCHQMPETVLHALWECPALRPIWDSF
nr:putative ribonuclease h protein [Quercus suber]